MNPMNPGGYPPANGPQFQQGQGLGQAPGAGAPSPYGYAAPSGAPNMGGFPGMPGAGPQVGPSGMPATRYDGAQASIQSAGSTVGAMRIGFLVFGGLMLVGGLVTAVTSGLLFGLGLLIAGVSIAATGWFVLPQFLGQLNSASALVGGLQAKEQLAMTGIPAVARIVQAVQTGTMVNYNPQIWLQLEVQGPQGVYAAQTFAVVPQLNLAQCQPGMSVNVRVNPQNPTEIAVVF